MSDPRQRLEDVKSAMARAMEKAGRKPGSVRLVAVSKTKSWQEIAAFADLGVTDFGENYMQEALAKKEALKDRDLNWHFIGTLQSNKAKFLVGNFHLFHGLDSLSLAQKINRSAEQSQNPVNCLIEVNIDEEETKGGVRPSELESLLSSLNALEFVKIQGLMCIPAANRKGSRVAFAKLRELMESVNEAGNYKASLKELSMGMSSDFEDAILEGATIVRVGTRLFGEREHK